MSNFDASQRFVAAQMARENLYFFSRWMFLQRKGFQWMRGPQHKVICDALMRVYRGECKRLIINVAPRYSKTELAVINFIAWSLGHVPDAEFIHISYSARLAANNSWQARELVTHPAYREIFTGLALRSDSSAKDEWRTTADGCVYATGTGGTITGYGAGKHRPGFGGAIIIDDPHKADEARSDTIRKGVIDWFQTTLESRKNGPDTPIILIMQRLHESDLAGFLLAGGNGEQWDHVCLQTLLDDGAALWPEKHSADVLRTMQTAAPYTFAGQYQQSPTTPEGNIFKPDVMPVIDALPIDDDIRWIRGWDFGATTTGDWTAGLKLGVGRSKRYYIGAVTRMRGGPDEVELALKNTADADGKRVMISIPQDPGQAGKTQVLAFTRLLAGHNIKSSPESGDKITRAEPFAAQVNVGNVSMLRGEWNQALIDEMRVFPNGTFDDQVDAGSRAFAELIGNNADGLIGFYQQQAAEIAARKASEGTT